MNPILATELGLVCLALIVFARSYKYHLVFDAYFFSIKFWYGAGLLLAAGLQYCILQVTTDPLAISVIDGLALYAAYIQICRD